MSLSVSHPTSLQSYIERFAAGDDAALDGLLRHASARLETLTRNMFRDYSRVRRWEETADVVQNASIRLLRALQSTRLTDVRGFYALAALQIRRELIDLARHYFGPEGLGAKHESRDDLEAEHRSHDDSSDAGQSTGSLLLAASSTFDPQKLASWSEFHEHAGALPDEDRQVFDLIYYQGLSQADAGAVLGLSERTLQRRWRSARITLHDALGGRLPA